MLLKTVQEAIKLFKWKRSKVSVQCQEEILHLKKKLAGFNIEFSNLVHLPSGIEVQNLIEISKAVAHNEELISTLSLEKGIAIQQLIPSCGSISPRILEENHQYILTMAHILGGPYPYLRKYISVLKT